MKKALLIITAICVSAPAFAFDLAAFDNATIQPGGPRTGANGKNFYNIEGSNNGTNASYGVQDHRTTGVNYGFSQTVGHVSSLTFKYTQQNAAFTVNGPLQFWVAQNTTTSIQPSVSPLRFSDSGSPLNPLLIGSGNFTQISNGASSTFTCTTLSAAAETYIVGQLNARGTLRFVVTAGSTTTAATLAGFSNTSSAGPIVSITATPVPEPASMAVLGLGAAALIRKRRQK